MTLNCVNPSLVAVISTGNLATNEIFHHASCYKSMQYKSDKFKRDKARRNEMRNGKRLKRLTV